MAANLDLSGDLARRFSQSSPEPVFDPDALRDAVSRLTENEFDLVFDDFQIVPARGNQLTLGLLSTQRGDQPTFYVMTGRSSFDALQRQVCNFGGRVIANEALDQNDEEIEFGNFSPRWLILGSPFESAPEFSPKKLEGIADFLRERPETMVFSHYILSPAPAKRVSPMLFEVAPDLEDRIVYSFDLPLSASLPKAPIGWIATTNPELTKVMAERLMDPNRRSVDPRSMAGEEVSLRYLLQREQFQISIMQPTSVAF